MKKMKLSTKLTLVVLLATTVVMAAIFAYLYFDGQKRDTEYAYSISEAVAKENGALVQSHLNTAMDSAYAIVEYTLPT
jgi:hypothetical protein